MQGSGLSRWGLALQNQVLPRTGTGFRAVVRTYAHNEEQHVVSEKEGCSRLRSGNEILKMELRWVCRSSDPAKVGTD